MSYYSKLGGVSMSELENLESEFLELIEFNLFIEHKLYDKYYNDLMSLKNMDIDEELYEQGDTNYNFCNDFNQKIDEDEKLNEFDTEKISELSTNKTNTENERHD